MSSQREAVVPKQDDTTKHGRSAPGRSSFTFFLLFRISARIALNLFVYVTSSVRLSPSVCQRAHSRSDCGSYFIRILIFITWKSAIRSGIFPGTIPRDVSPNWGHKLPGLSPQFDVIQLQLVLSGAAGGIPTRFPTRITLRFYPHCG